MSRSVVPWFTEYIIRQNSDVKHSLLQSNRSYVYTYTPIEESVRKFVKMVFRIYMVVKTNNECQTTQIVVSKKEKPQKWRDNVENHA